MTTDENVNEINNQILILEAKKQGILFDRVRACDHEFIYSLGGGAHPHGSDIVVCRECGLSLPAGSGGLINTAILNFNKSELIVSKSKVDQHVKLSDMQICAIKYPKRFTKDFLKKVFENTPFDFQEVLDKNKDHYSFGDKYYNTYNEWLHDNVAID